MTARASDVIFLQPGELFFGSGQRQIRTVLGSCVALVLWHPQRRLGGMCHFVLPRRQGEAGAALDARYGDEAIEMLRLAAQKHGTRLGEYNVWLFGGGNMFPHVAGSATPLVGEQNIEVADRLSRRLGLHIVQRDVGTARYRNVVLNLADGSVSSIRTAITMPVMRS